MTVELVFHISKWEKNNGYKLLDGRVIRDISLTDELIMLENVDIGYYNCNCDREGRLVIDDEPYEMIQINRIFSYGRVLGEFAFRNVGAS